MKEFSSVWITFFKDIAKTNIFNFINKSQIRNNLAFILGISPNFVS